MNIGAVTANIVTLTLARSYIMVYHALLIRGEYRYGEHGNRFVWRFGEEQRCRDTARRLANTQLLVVWFVIINVNITSTAMNVGRRTSAEMT